MIEIILSHKPPSTNQLYRNASGGDRKKGRIRTDRYNTWRQAVGWELNKVHGKISGPYVMQISLCRSMRHHAEDIGNREKAVSDILQEHGIIENDRFCEDLRIRWADTGGKVVILLDEWKENGNG